MKKIRGLYISTCGKIDSDDDYVAGTFKQFNELLTGDEKIDCSYDHLGDDFKVLYNNKSNEPYNVFINRYVANTAICGPVIIIKNKGDIELDAHKTLGKNVLIQSLDFRL